MTNLYPGFRRVQAVTRVDGAQHPTHAQRPTTWTPQMKGWGGDSDSDSRRINQQHQHLG